MIQRISRSIFLISLLGICHAAYAAPRKNKAANERGNVESQADKPDLARVSIVRYADVTQTKNFGYMPDSLTEAIDKSLQIRFEYRREEPEKTDAAMALFRKKNPQLNAETAADFCRKNKTDILIYGDFSFDALTNEIVVKTSISLGSTSKFRALPERRNPVNATIFKLADLVADDIVRNLTEIAKEQAPEKQAKSGGNNKAEKIELKKNTATAWSETNWNITPGLTVLLPLNSSFSGNRAPQGMLSLSAERRLWGGFYFGLRGSGMSVKASTISIDLFTASAFLAYHWQLSARWDLFAQLGAGYYAGKYYNNATCSSNCTAGSGSESFKINNPYFTLRAGANFLIFNWLSLGLFGQGDIFYDKPTPLYFGGGGASVGFQF